MSPGGCCRQRPTLRCSGDWTTTSWPGRRDTHPGLADRDDLPFLADVLAAVPRLRDKLDTSDEPVGRAIVDAAIGWRRAGMVAAISEQNLHALTEVTVKAYTLKPLTEQAFSDGLDWATEPVTVAAVAALLTPTDSGGWTAFDALVSEAAPPTDQLWAAILDYTATEDLISIGLAARFDSQMERASLAWRKAADLGDTDAMYNLGVLLDGRGEVTEAEDWYHKAADRGHAAAMYNLGLLQTQR